MIYGKTEENYVTRKKSTKQFSVKENEGEIAKENLPIHPAPSTNRSCHVAKLARSDNSW